MVIFNVLAYDKTGRSAAYIPSELGRAGKGVEGHGCEWDRGGKGWREEERQRGKGAGGGGGGVTNEDYITSIPTILDDIFLLLFFSLYLSHTLFWGKWC